MDSINFKTPSNDKQNEGLKKSVSEVISHRIKEHRENLGMTQQELAENAALHLTYVSHLEAGKYHPSVFVLWKIAKVLKVKLDDFI